MGVILTRELVRVDQVIGEDRAQTVVEGVINLPDGKPDIERVISVDAFVNNGSIETEILGDVGKVIIEGTVDVNAMYVGRVPQGSQPVHFVEGTIDFSFFVKIPGARKNMDVRVKTIIEHIQSGFDPHKPREIRVRMILLFVVKVTVRVEIEIVIDATGPEDLQVLKRMIRIEDVIGEARTQAIVKGDVTVPEVKPNIEEIIKVEARAKITGTKIIKDKVILEGVLILGILYVGIVPETMPQQPVHFMEAELPFTQFVEIPGARENMAKFYKVEVEHIKGRRKDERTVTIEAIIKIRVKIFETKVFQVVVDVFSPSEQLEVEKTRLKLDQVIGEDENEIVVKDTLTVPNEKPDIEQIYKTNCRAEVTEVRIIDDKVIVEGVLILETIYVAIVDPGLPQQPVHFMEHRVEFTTFVDIPGARSDMTFDFDVVVEHCSSNANPHDRRRFDVRAVIGLFAKVTQMLEIDIVINVIEPEIVEPEPVPPEKEKPGQEKKGQGGGTVPPTPSMIIYIVQRGDTLWAIAKRYNVTIQSIVGANNLANPDMLDIGQQLVIPRT